MCAPATSATIRRDGADLYSDASVSQAELDAGGSVEVSHPVSLTVSLTVSPSLCLTVCLPYQVITVEGSTGALKVAAGTKPMAYLRIKGRGAPTVVGSLDDRGDHYFRLVVKDDA